MVDSVAIEPDHRQEAADPRNYQSGCDHQEWPTEVGHLVPFIGRGGLGGLGTGLALGDELVEGRRCGQRQERIVENRV
jgi:hypothetical protein